MRDESSPGWPLVTRLLHWVTAILVVAQLPLGIYAHGLALSLQKIDAFIWHKSIGMLILLLVVSRICWRLLHKSPPPLTDNRAVQLAAGTVHGVLYLLLLALPISGWIATSAANIPFRFFWTVQVPMITEPSDVVAETAGEFHGVMAAVLVSVVAMHVVAALWHHFRLRDATLRRMGFAKK